LRAYQFLSPRQSPFLKLNFLGILQSEIIKRRRKIEIQRLWLPAGGMDMGVGGGVAENGTRNVS